VDDVCAVVDVALFTVASGTDPGIKMNNNHTIKRGVNIGIVDDFIKLQTVDEIRPHARAHPTKKARTNL
jgi:hypothetical protein